MKVAIIHDWLEKKGGAEKVLEELFYIYPKADLFVIVDLFVILFECFVLFHLKLFENLCYVLN